MEQTLYQVEQYIFREYQLDPDFPVTHLLLRRTDPDD